MGTLLLYNPWIQIYLLYAGVLAVIFIWDCLHSAPVTVERIRTPPNEAAAVPPPRRSQEPCSALSQLKRRVQS